MSRVGRQPIQLPKGVEVTVDGVCVAVKGPKGELQQSFDPAMTVTVDTASEGTTVRVARPSDQVKHRALHGLTRSLVNNMVLGVSEGFSKNLEIEGVGYRADQSGAALVLNVGFSHTVNVDPPPGIELKAVSQRKITVAGIDKELVGRVAAQIRQVRPPEPYKGKGIRYEGEQVRRKAGKAAGG
ncbi:MAG: 50S ribosomal protein L6 [Gemmatimonadetes bacterium]|nr:50S ribosomal protein L6 [Gemmatimonadota bacterium]